MFTKKCSRKVLKLLLWLCVVLALGYCGVRIYRVAAPHIELAQARSATITVSGGGFGSRGYLAFHSGGKESDVHDAKSWAPTRIVAPISPNVELGTTVQVVRNVHGMLWRSAPVQVVMQAEGLPSTPYGYATPVAPKSPWPLFRRDHRNTGRSPIQAKYQGDKPWAYHTGKGIFSTPVIGADGTVYVGSADHGFYAVGSDGSLKWKFGTGGIIDSAAALHRGEPDAKSGAVTVISGDGIMYHLKTDAAISDPAQRIVWTFDASREPGAGYNNWWEGNVALGFDGTLYAGNTNWSYYAIRPDGKMAWRYGTGSNSWSQGAFGDDGTIFWGALDAKVRAIAPNGVTKWSKYTWGMVAASAAIGSDGTLYIGSFDSYLYAIDSKSGATKWTFKTGDHIYASVALGCASDGSTDALYFGSTDGIFYALDTAGHLRWSYDTGDPIRSSAALGRAPEGEPGDIVYFGSGNGVLYALHAEDGTRRWSFDTTPEGIESRDRNDLNGSVALGTTGVYIGGEHGNLCYVPYDYPLHASDPHAKTEPTEDLPADCITLRYVTPGGTTTDAMPETISPATVMTFRLIVRQEGRTVAARMRKDALHVEANPSFPFVMEVSADGHYVHIRPEGFLEPATAYTLALKGDYSTGGLHVGNLTVGGRKTGSFENSFAFKTDGTSLPRLPMTVERDRVTAFEWTRLAVVLPTMMPSLNQIGFDDIDCIVSAIRVTEPDAQGAGKAVLWMTPATRGDDGVLRATPKPDFMIPLNGSYRGGEFIVRNDQFTLGVQNLPIPFKILELRGQMDAHLTVKTGATAYAEADVWSIPTFGPLMVFAGLGSDVYKKLVTTGTYITRPCDATCLANARPAGVEVERIDFLPPTRKASGHVVAHLRHGPDSTYKTAEHRPALLLIDADRTEAVVMDYLANVKVKSDPKGFTKSIDLTLPAGMRLPERPAAVVILDAFPVFVKQME